jgi:glutathionyl-hydroquinone reductase
MRLTDSIRKAIHRNATANIIRKINLAKADLEESLKLYFESKKEQFEKLSALNETLHVYGTANINCVYALMSKDQTILYNQSVKVSFSYLHNNTITLRIPTTELDLYTIAERLNELRVALKNAETELSTLMNAVGTTKRLIQTWPEGEQFIPKPEANTTMVPIHKLNDLLGL